MTRSKLDEQYSPLPKEVTNHMLRRWRGYREYVGLEGEAILEMRNKGTYTEEDAAKVVATKKELRSEWHELNKE